MRRIFGWLLVVLGALVFLPAAAAAIWVGTDDTAQTGPHGLTTPGVAIVAEPSVLRYVGPVLHLTVERADGGPVFLGVAHEVNATSYLGEHSRRVVSRVGLPWDVDSGQRDGVEEALAAPGDQPWWIASVEGEGAQELVWPIPHGSYRIAALNADGSSAVEVDVTLGLEIAGTFYTILAVAAFGLLLLLLGLWLLLWRRRRRRTVAAEPGDDVELADASSPYGSSDPPRDEVAGGGGDPHRPPVAQLAADEELTGVAGPGRRRPLLGSLRPAHAMGIADIPDRRRSRTTGSGARRPARTAGLVVAVALGLTGCGLIPVEDNTFESAPLPATTQDNAEEVLDGLDEAITAADAARDPVLLAEVVGGPLLDIRTAGYAIDSLTDPEDAEPAAPTDHADPTVFIPRFAGYPQWFVVASTIQEDGPLRLEVLSRESAAATWVTLIAPELLPEVEFPELELDDTGYVVPLSVNPDAAPADDAPTAETPTEDATTEAAPSEPTPTGSAAASAVAAGATTTAPTTEAGPTTEPSTTESSTGDTPIDEVAIDVVALVEQHAAALSGAEVDGLAAGLAADGWTQARDAADTAAAEAVGEAATLTSTYAVADVLDQALRTADGGALVFYALTGSRAYAVTPTYFLTLDATTAAIVGADEVTTELTEQWTAQLAVYVPPDEDDVPRVVAATWDRTGLTGS